MGVRYSKNGLKFSLINDNNYHLPSALAEGLETE